MITCQTIFPAYLQHTSLLSRSQESLGMGLLFAAGLVLGLAVVILVQMHRSVRNLGDAATRIAKGDLDAQAPLDGPQPFQQLADALNSLRDQVQERIATAQRRGDRLEALVSAMSEGVVAIDSQQKVFLLNQAALPMLGLTNAPNLPAEIRAVVSQPALQTPLTEALAYGTSSQQQIHLPATIYITTQPARTLQVQCTCIRDPQGNITGALLMMYDITNLQHLQQVRQDFVANVSHELRTPLATMLSAAELLQEQDLPDNMRQRTAEAMLRQTKRMTALLDDLRILTHLDYDPKAQLEKSEPCDLSALTQDIYTQYAPLCAKQNVEIIFENTPNLHLQLHPSLITQAITNLLDNALRYGASGGRIILKTIRCDQEIRISVQDFGPGIAREHQTRIFERFYRTDTARSREQGGTGLGLSIVRHIAIVHNGHSSVESEIGNGSTFHIHLPDSLLIDNSKH